MSAVTVHIDTLAFPGLGAAAARRAANAFEAQLTELLQRYGLPAGRSSADLERVDLGKLPPGAGTPEAMGRALARALFEKVAA